MNARFTKIICTLGPASSSEETIEAMIRAGMDVARINLSHGNPESQAAIVERVRRIAERLHTPVAVLADLQGPRIRVGVIREGVVLEKGQDFSITTREILGDSRLASTNYASLCDDVHPGNHILIDDGLLRLEVCAVTDDTVQCRVLEGGPLHSRKGVNLPHVAVSAPSLTLKDEKDLRSVLGWGVDYVALSFVRRVEDITRLRELMQQDGCTLPIIAKIERPEAVAAIEDIIQESDGVMVARGDLGVEMSSEEVPLLQKMIIRKALAGRKPVITATQMLESMVSRPRPTRAESSDVANAVLDGTSAVMLSAETSVGKYPVEAVQAMARIIGTVESKDTAVADTIARTPAVESVVDAVAHAACRLAESLDARAIVTVTHSGYTAGCVASYRPRRVILGITDDPQTQRVMNLYWGVRGVLVPTISDTDTTLETIEQHLRHENWIRPGEAVVYTAGMPLPQRGITNMLKVSVVE